MKLLPCSLLLVSCCTLSSWSASPDSVVVTQTHDVSVMEGETVHITCCWTGVSERKTVNWMRNQTDIKSFFFSKDDPNCSNLTFTNITREDSGRYTCRVSVETPSLKVFEGKGTVVTVTATGNTNPTGGHSTSNLPMIISLAVVAPLLAIALVYLRTLQRRQGSAKAAKVIYEVPHIDSEEAESDKHSTSSSRGSSQWCQVPVYESFDYFERLQTKDSG